MRTFFSVLFLCLMVAFWPLVPVAVAQTAGVETASGSKEAIGEFASKLTPEQSIALAKFLEALAQDNQAAASALAVKPSITQLLRSSLSAFGDRLSHHVKQLPAAIVATGQAFVKIFTTRGTAASFTLLGVLALVLTIGTVATGAVAWFTKPLRLQIHQSKPDVFSEQIRTLTLRLAIELSGLIAFMVASVVSTYVLVSDVVDRSLIIAILSTVVAIIWLTSVFMRFLLGPKRPELRLVATDDWTAQFIFKCLVSLAAVIAAGLFLLGLFDRYSIPLADTFRFWVGLFVVLGIGAMTWRARQGMTSIIKGEDELLTVGLERMAAWWPTFSIVVVSLTWLFIQFSTSAGGFRISAAQGSAALALIMAAPFLDTMLRGIIKHMVPPVLSEGAIAEEAHRQTRFSYVRIGRVIMFATLIMIIGRLLGISFRNLAEAGLGAQIAANGVQFLLTLATGYMAWEVVNLWASRQLGREMPSEAANQEAWIEQAAATAKSRLASVLPLVRITLQIAIIVMTVLLGLSQLGLNITPLLAGAGVVGLAVGFGAQALVKDIVSGVFFLLDDAFRLGEYIDVGDTLGTVEKISIRSLQLRGAKGPVHIVPYGEIHKLTNHSRDWVIVKLRFTVPYDTNVEKVRKIFKKIGIEMMQNPEYAEDMLQPFKSQGVADVNDVGIVVRGKFTAKPGTQFMMRKEIFSRVQEAFEANGIQFARKEVRVQFPVEQAATISAEQKQSIAAAAADAAEPKSV